MTATLGDRHLEQFARQRTALTGAAPWLFPAREAAHAAARSLGMPGPRDEAWRFTNLRDLAAREWPLTVADGEAQLDFADTRLGTMDAIRMVFVDGRLDRARSQFEDLPAGVTLLDLRDALASRPELLESRLTKLEEFDRRYFPALNTALFHDGCLLHLAEGVRLERPVHLRFLRATAARSWNPRLLIALEAGASASVLEEHRAGGEGFSNVVAEIDLAAGARLSHAKLVREHAGGTHLAAIGGRIDREAHYAGFSIVSGGQLVRNEYDLRLEGEDAQAELDGLVVSGGAETVDHHTRIAHLVPRTKSREDFRHILDGESHAIFCGRVDVAVDAQKTDAEQQNRNLLLSDGARMNTMPQLMIHADDVKCSHGATLGQLDEDALFYLRTRGIGLEAARRVLVHGFASEMVDRLPFAELREELRALFGIEAMS